MNQQDQVDRCEALLAIEWHSPASVRDWLAEVWRFLLETGLYFAGGPKDAVSVLRLRLVERVKDAAQIEDDSVRAEALRISAHVMNASERYDEAVSLYSQAIPLLEQVGEVETAVRTRLGYCAALMMTGEYNQALNTIGEAESWMIREGDEFGLAQVLINTSNVWHRKDRHERALDCLLDAKEIFDRLYGDRVGDLDLAGLCLNIANSYSYVCEFDSSSQMYEEAQKYAESAGNSSLVEQCWYNQAYLNFLRGWYSEAIEAFTSLKERFRDEGGRHAALCDLDLAEVYLELDMPDDARSHAASARGAFSQLSMSYEAAKAAVFEGAAARKTGDIEQALALLEVAEDLFGVEHNEYWVGVIELARAEIELQQGHPRAALHTAQRSLRRFRELNVPYQIGLGLLLLGKTFLAMGEKDKLTETVDQLRSLVWQHEVPLLGYSVNVFLGEVEESAGNRQTAIENYRDAAASIEENWVHLHQDELRLGYLENKCTVYESLVHLELDGQDGGYSSLAFEWIERAKARVMADHMSQHLTSIGSAENPRLLEEVSRAREIARRRRFQESSGRIERKTHIEDEGKTQARFASDLRELVERDRNIGGLIAGRSTSPEAVQEMLPEDTSLLEYYVCRGEVLAFLIDGSRVRLYRRMSSVETLTQLLQSIRFQLGQFELGTRYVQQHEKQINESTQHYLQQLHQQLVDPWVRDVQTRSLVVVAHSEIHGLPLHAAYDGKQYLIDQFQVSYASSAEILGLLLQRPELPSRQGLIIGSGDEQTPAIEKEIELLGDISRDSTVIRGESATRQKLFDLADRHAFLHIASHAYFRRDNPLFSGFVLEDGPVVALELFSRTWPLELVMLSGCSSGVGDVSAGDDLSGLIRGFFYAGARSLVLSGWNVSDETTLALSQEFYRGWLGGYGKAEALNAAMHHVRDAYPQPFYWAPFFLSGAP